MLVSSYESGVTPEFTIERSGSTVTLAFAYDLAAAPEEPFWDGSLSARLGLAGAGTNEDGDARMKIAFSTSLNEGEIYGGYWQFVDDVAGIDVLREFDVALFDFSTVYTGLDVDTCAFGSIYGDTLSGNGGDDALDGAGGDDLLLGGVGRDRLYGGVGLDALHGGEGSDRLEGGADADSLYGGDDNDVLIGGAGADRIEGGGGGDTASYAGAASRVVASLANPSINAGDAAGDVYVSVENLTGSSFNDVLNGTNGANILKGNGGGDLLKGYGGADRLFGGAGRDAFIFNAGLGPGNVDRIEDYVVADDTIWLDDAVFSKLGVAPSNYLSSSGFTSNRNGEATDALHRIIYETDTGRLYHDRDGTGAAAKVHFATLDPNLALVATDFYVI